jgi:hypothetical protein
VILSSIKITIGLCILDRLAATTGAQVAGYCNLPLANVGELYSQKNVGVDVNLFVILIVL